MIKTLKGAVFILTYYGFFWGTTNTQPKAELDSPVDILAKILK